MLKDISGTSVAETETRCYKTLKQLSGTSLQRTKHSVGNKPLKELSGTQCNVRRLCDGRCRRGRFVCCSSTFRNSRVEINYRTEMDTKCKTRNTRLLLVMIVSTSAGENGGGVGGGGVERASEPERERVIHL